MRRRTRTVSQKNTTVIYFARSHEQSRVSIDFWCTNSKIQSTGHCRRISPWKVIWELFHENMRWS
ncbi:hypothetical protein BHE74_00007424 [Ensete ventricosum]|nr:hypothetical protein BHE74_00007424 [Ensete ventricosum]